MGDLGGCRIAADAAGESPNPDRIAAHDLFVSCILTGGVKPRPSLPRSPDSPVYSSKSLIRLFFGGRS